MLDHPEDEHDVEAPVGIGEPPRLLVGQELRRATGRISSTFTRTIAAKAGPSRR
jgi:hypothetical protein